MKSKIFNNGKSLEIPRCPEYCLPAIHQGHQPSFCFASFLFVIVLKISSLCFGPEEIRAFFISGPLASTQCPLYVKWVEGRSLLSRSIISLPKGTPETYGRRAGHIEQ